MSPFLVPIVFFISVPVGIIGIMLTRAYIRRMEGNPYAQQLSPELSDRLDRMEQAIDSIAVEVERVSESQRFVTSLLAQRSEPNPAIGAPSSKGDAA